MSDIIRLLPENLANQIAAGEVVQRPASAVKELLENSIDSGCSQIQLILKDAGKALIQVIDNGSGMSETDARMCFERHATSKIKATQDLFEIKTFGFRGEAMASIAAVAQVELKTKKEESEVGVCIKIEGSEVKSQEAVACNKGTSVAVKNLFFNVPARRNFLKSNPVEMRHIVDEFQRVALAYPEIGMNLLQNDLEVYQLPSEKLSKRIVSLFGNSYKEQMIACNETTDFIKVHGYVGKPEHSKKTRGEQFFFVNRRFIKNNYLHHAVMNAFESLIQDEAFPFYVIFIEIDPKHIDINVHPTKTEIKFDDEKTVYGVVRAAVKKALATHNIIPTLDFDLDVNFNQFSYQPNNSVPSEFKPLTEKHSSNFNSGKNWESLYDGFEKKQDIVQPRATQESFIIGSSINSTNEKEESGKEWSNTENLTLFQLHNQYIVTQIKSGLALIDQQAAHERILYEKYLGMLENRKGASQQVLFPLSIDLNPSDYALIMELEEEIKSLGFQFSIFGKNSIVIDGVPADITSGNEKGIFEGLIEQYKIYNSELKLEKREIMARSMARRSGLKRGAKLNPTEMNTIIGQLFACKNPLYTPNGENTIVMLGMDKIEKLFNR